MDYVYFPLRGDRRGDFRRRLNLFVTKSTGGLWHKPPEPSFFGARSTVSI
jgi:hypothetical protein